MNRFKVKLVNLSNKDDQIVDVVDGTNAFDAANNAQKKHKGYFCFSSEITACEC